MKRRAFLKAAAAGTAVAIQSLAFHESCGSPGETEQLTHYGLHPFIENNPDAVFILRTHVAAKTDTGAKKRAGLDFGRSVFVKRARGEAGARPLDSSVALKPNITCRESWDPRYSIERTMGIVTDAAFVEGVIESLKGLGVGGDQVHMLEVNCPQDFDDGGYWGVAERTGAVLKDRSAPIGVIAESEIQWVDLPSGVWFTKIPYLKPLNSPNSWLLNIAKLKAHEMGMTLCVKNLQGSIAKHYQAHCNAYGSGMNIDPAHIVPNADSVIMANYARHVANGVPRWDKPGESGGIWQETWATRCLDNQSKVPAGLHVIEGIYGRDGNFIDGPSPEGLATDYMTNMVIFGKNPFHVDIIGNWLAGHEPGNFGLFHLAVERGFIGQFNPLNIPLYEWQTDGQAVLTPPADFPRTPLKTLYLQRDYDGQTEPLWHLVNEPFNYAPIPLAVRLEPRSRVWRYVRSDAHRATSAIEITVPEADCMRLEISNARGQIIGVPFEGRISKGKHLAVWSHTGRVPGNYRYQLRSSKFSSAGEFFVG